MIPSFGTLPNLRTIDWSLLERNHCQFLACQGALAGLQGFTPSSLLPATTSLASYARIYPRWWLDPFRSYTRSFKLSSTPANLTIPTRTSIIALPQMTTSSPQQQPHADPALYRIRTPPKEGLFPKCLCFLVFLWLGKELMGARHNARLAHACSEFTALFLLLQTAVKEWRSSKQKQKS